MNAALEKLKAKLFEGTSPAELGLDPLSERVFPEHDASKGGLGYSFVGLKSPARIEVLHDRKDEFHVYTFVSDDNFGERSRTASNLVRFAFIQREFKRAIDLVRSEFK